MEELRVIYTVADPGFLGGWRGPSGAGVGGGGGHTDAVLTNSSHMLMLGTHIPATNPKLTARKVGSPPHKKRPIPFIRKIVPYFCFEVQFQQRLKGKVLQDLL